MTYNPNTVIVHLGDPFENPHEERFLNKLRRDLISRGISANILANFVTPRPNQRQIDFLVLTESRLTHVELKALAAVAPITGTGNGPWLQRRPSGATHEIRPNPYRQAHEGTYAIKDAAARLIHRGRATAVDGEFYRHIDTVVCVDPSIPTGSDLDRYTHVNAIGYDQLVDRLATPGPRPAWSDADWDEFCRHLGVYQEEEGSPSAIRRRSAAEAVKEYSHRFASTVSSGLHELVPVGFASGPTTIDVLAELEGGRNVTFLGLSGTGKSHTARHLAVELSRRGALVLWLRADEYEKGRFGPLLAKAAAPYSSRTAIQLAQHGATLGRRLVVVVDGFNECPGNLRPEFLEQLSAFTLRYPASVLLTTTDTDALPEELTQTLVALRAPQGEERSAVLSSYGAPTLEHVSAAFITALELAVAARCHTDLTADATLADLYDVYVRRFCPAESQREGLRALATELAGELRTSMRLSDATRLLGSRAGANLDPAVIDSVLASPLLRAEQGRIGFSHERLGRFLAAEQLVLTAIDEKGLAAALLEPGRQDLAAFALELDRDPGRQSDILRALADPVLYLDALRGRFGPGAADTALSAIAGALAEAAFTATVDNATFETVDEYFGLWQMHIPWTPAQVALLRAAGLALRHGMFVPEVATLLDRTDTVLAAAAELRRSAGAKNHLSVVISGAYVLGSESSRSLAATLVVQAEAHRAGWVGRDPSPVPVDQLLSEAGPQSWGRLYVACEAADHRVPAHRSVMVDLLTRAWTAGSYHLRLEALQMVGQNGRGLDPATAEAMATTVDGLRTDHPFLQSSIVEALAACGRVVTDVTADDIAKEVDAVLSNPLDTDHRQLAAHLVGLMFEDEELVGPVYEVIEKLPPRHRALLMATAASVSGWMFQGWALGQSIKHVDPNDSVLWNLQLAVLQTAAAPPARSGFNPQEEIQVHVAAVRGLARLAGETRSPTPPTDERDTVWGLVDGLLAGLEGATVDAAGIWEELIDQHAAAAVEVLSELSWASILDDDFGSHNQLIAGHPDDVRGLLEWGLAHRDSLPQPPSRSLSDLENYIIRTLGQIGDDRSARLLECLRHDPDRAEQVVNALSNLNARR